jgi:hypothetical protein
VPTTVSTAVAATTRCGAARDRLIFSGVQGPVLVDLRDGTASGTDTGTDTVRLFNQVTGSPADDILFGEDGADALNGGPGNDWPEALRGLDGDDGDDRCTNTETETNCER